MAYQMKEGQGSLFKNEKQNDRQPDLKGSVMIKGVLYELAGWYRTSQNGRQYISLQAAEPSADRNNAARPGSVSPYQQSQPYQQTTSYGSQAPSYQQAPAPTLDDMPAADDNDLPF
ncbi:MAG: hypothetical protein PUD85_02015 [Bacteroidales bacterium]|nr:hypothetical protein [Bacteroidales bacterium]